MWEIILICLAIGVFAGFIAGLLGLGGGTVVVPTLYYVLPFVGIRDEILMSVALGTSFATIVVSTLSAAQQHHKNGNADWNVAKILVPALMVSVFISSLFVSNLPKAYLTKIFAVIMMYLALKMLLSLKKDVIRTKPLTTQSTLVAGAVIGAISSMAGVGGGAFIVPFLNGRGVALKRAIGTSSICGSLLGLSGAMSFVVSGWDNPLLPNYSLGYVYLPALLGITISSYFTSRLGANVANKLPVSILKRVFAVFLIFVGLSMVFK
ncbi:sulfite exporter TauE/SafE family protein [Cricetibacter osteomyelitidis]|nr:sulfite exporter TauE/SafE family protein [Cricetibacter osteomyelitidis]